jgi:5-methylcytosine-specific restriction endonuclease McrA
MIRRYAPMKPSRGTVIPSDMRLRVLARDAKATGGCVGFGRFPVECSGPLELDHVRASHGMGMKSETTDDNLVALCGNCHRYKTAFGRQARPILLDYLAGQVNPHDAHVDPCSPECHRVTA